MHREFVLHMTWANVCGWSKSPASDCGPWIFQLFQLFDVVVIVVVVFGCLNCGYLRTVFRGSVSFRQTWYCIMSNWYSNLFRLFFSLFWFYFTFFRSVICIIFGLQSQLSCSFLHCSLVWFLLFALLRIKATIRLILGFCLSLLKENQKKNNKREDCFNFNLFVVYKMRNEITKT